MHVAGLDELYSDHLRTLARRTDTALAAARFDALVIHAGAPPMLFLDDQAYPYKVNPHFKAWVPVIDNPGCLLIYTPGRVPHLLFHRAEDYWHKPARVPHEPWTEHVEITPLAEPTLEGAGFWTGLGRVAFIGPPAAFPGVPEDSLNAPDLLQKLHYDRAVKTPYELECMRRANKLGAHGHREALAAFLDGASEYETHMRYLEACEQREEEMPYNNIVAHNENAAVLHYQHLERRPPHSLRSLLIDAGAQFRGYAADITRTYAAASGPFSDLIAALNTAQLRMCGEIVAGRDYREVHLFAHRLVGDVLEQVGVTTLPGQAALEAGVTGVFFPHGIGHLLGLQVHDVGGVMGDPKGGERARPEGHPYLRLTRTLEPGVVVTVEPGIYFIDSLLEAARKDARGGHIDWSMVERLRPYGGVRIEDDVVTTESVPENLTRDAFAKLAA